MRGRFVVVVGLTTALWMIQSPGAQAATVVALWHMDDVGSAMTDASGNGLTGTLKNVATGQPGSAATAFGFAKTPSYVSVSSSKLNPGTATFTVSARVRFTVLPSAAVGDYDIIRKGLSTTTGGDWKMEILRSGYAFCLFQGSSGKVSLSHGPSLADDRWHTITCQRTTTGVRLTVDGGSWSKAGATGKIANSSAVLLGAKSTSGADQYQGLLDEVAVSTG